MKTVETSITVKEFREMVNKGYYLVEFSEDKEIKDSDSLIIHALIEEGYSIPPLYFLKKDDGLCYSHNRTQNGIVISKYINGDFSLSKDTRSAHDKQGKIIEIAKKYFGELSKEFQERILNYNLTIYCFEEVATTDDIIRISYKATKGKDLTEEHLKILKTLLTEELKIVRGKFDQMELNLYDNIVNWKKILS